MANNKKTRVNKMDHKKVDTIYIYLNILVMVLILINVIASK